MKRNTILLITAFSLSLISSAIFTMGSRVIFTEFYGEQTEHTQFYEAYAFNLRDASRHFGYGPENPETGCCVALPRVYRRYPRTIGNLSKLTEVDLKSATAYAPAFKPFFPSRGIPHPFVFGSTQAMFFAWKDAARYADWRDNTGWRDLRARPGTETKAYQRAVRGLCEKSQEFPGLLAVVERMIDLCRKRKGKDTVDGQPMLGVIEREFQTCDACKQAREDRGNS